jgi:hypothetical protein
MSAEDSGEIEGPRFLKAPFQFRLSILEIGQRVDWVWVRCNLQQFSTWEPGFTWKLLAPFLARKFVTVAPFFEGVGDFGPNFVFGPVLKREFFIDNLLVRIHSIIKMILEDRPFAMEL